jgi:hypothetical protein
MRAFMSDRGYSINTNSRRELDINPLYPSHKSCAMQIVAA